MKIILGSQSLSRAKILQDMEYAFDTMSADIDEKAIRDQDPYKLTLALAHAKADALVKRISEPALIITSDQVAVCNGTIREKPTNTAEAEAFLHSYSHHPAETITSVVVTNTETGKRFEGTDHAAVWFRFLPNDVIKQLIDEGDVFRCAGWFSVEGPLLKKYRERVEGTIDSIMGLPKHLVKELLCRAQEK